VHRELKENLETAKVSNAEQNAPRSLRLMKVSRGSYLARQAGVSLLRGRSSRNVGNGMKRVRFESLIHAEGISSS
jgi:hypothetical protein